jgi:hypothetical protein
MKSVAISLLFLVFSYSLHCQHDFLEPRQNYENRNIPLNKYINDVVYEIGFNHDDYLFQFIEIKKGETEKTFYVEQQDTNFSLIINILNGHIIQGGGTRIIQKNLGYKLLNLIQITMAQTQFQEGWEPQKDSALFLFNLRDEYGKVHYAEKWNPDENSNIGELTRICHIIFAYDTIYKPDLSPLETRIDALTKKMEASLAIYLANKSDVKTIRYYVNDYYEINSSKDTITYYEVDYKLDYVADTMMGLRVKKVEKYVKENNATWRNLTTGETGIQFAYIEKYYERVYNLKTRQRYGIHHIFRMTESMKKSALSKKKSKVKYEFI